MDNDSNKVWEYIGGCLIIIIGGLVALLALGVLILGLVYIWSAIFALVGK